MNNVNNEIKFVTASFKQEVVMYKKELGWDIYLCGKCIKVNATREEIQFLYKMLTKEI